MLTSYTMKQSATMELQAFKKGQSHVQMPVTKMNVVGTASLHLSSFYL